METITNVRQVHDSPCTSVIMTWKSSKPIDLKNGISIKHFLTLHSNEETNTKKI